MALTNKFIRPQVLSTRARDKKLGNLKSLSNHYYLDLDSTHFYHVCPRPRVCICLPSKWNKSVAMNCHRLVGNSTHTTLPGRVHLPREDGQVDNLAHNTCRPPAGIQGLDFSPFFLLQSSFLSIIIITICLV